jgi:hypothetical protein
MRTKSPFTVIVASIIFSLLLSSCKFSGNVPDPLTLTDPTTPTVTYAWSALGSGVGADAYYEEVTALAFDASRNLYAGGSFSKIGAENANNIAKWNGSSWSPLGSGLGTAVTDRVDDLVFDSSGNLYACGSFNSGWSAAKGLGMWNGSTWSPFGSYPTDASDARSLYGAPSEKLYVSFYQDAAPAKGFVASWSGSSWTFPTDESEKVDYPADAVVMDSSGNLYQGGSFKKNADLSTTLNYVAKCNSGSNILTPLGQGLDDAVYAMVVDALGNIYVGGEFYQTVGATPVVLNSVAKWNGSSWYPLGKGLDGKVYALALDSDGNLYAGGNFEGGIAKWNGSIWETVGGGVNGYVNAIAFYSSGSLYVGGAFDKAGDVNALNVAKWSKR